jgi:hypothetical protein
VSGLANLHSNRFHIGTVEWGPSRSAAHTSRCVRPRPS